MSCESYCRAASNPGLQQALLQGTAFMVSYVKYALQLLSDSKDANLHSIIHRAIASQYQYVIGNQNAVEISEAATFQARLYYSNSD